MSTLTLLRHGQAKFGSDHYDQLSPLGQIQARATGLHFVDRNWHFDRVIAGPRQRQQRTAELVSGRDPVDIETTDELDEFAEGNQILQAAEQRSDQLLDRQQRLRAYMAEITLWSHGTVDIDGVPSCEDFCAKIDQWLTHITGLPSSGQRLLAVTSAGVIAAVLCRVLDQPTSDVAKWMAILSNCSVTQLLFSPGRIGVQSINSTGHLATEMLSDI